jgi:hypothetical protein
MPAPVGRIIAWRVIAAISLIGLLGGCTVTDTVKDILSSTTPGDWYRSDGLPKAEYKVNVFVAINLENLKADIAKGRGEYLESLSTLLAVPLDRRSEFALLAQKQYPVLGAENGNAVARALTGLSESLHHL